MPFKIMYINNSEFWLQNEIWEYFIDQGESDKIKEKANLLDSRWEPGRIEPDLVVPEAADEAIPLGYGKEYEAIVAMTETERVQHIKESKNRLDSLIAQRPRQEQLITEALVETTRDAVLYNHMALLNVMKVTSNEAKQKTQELVESTRDLVKASSQLITTNIFNDELMETLVSKSNGTIIQHMTRVYLKGLAFLSYYNKLVSTSSVINKLRISFQENYMPFYHALLPHVHVEDLALERVFLGGMRAISENTFYNWATGFLVHDIGKAAAVEYHEGEAAYDRDIVMEHVNVGYTSIMNKTNYSRDAGLITGYHHEYYGDPSGYGYFRSSFEQYKNLNPQIKQNYCIAFDVEPMMEFETLAFFPAKVLEIVDVYDSFTDQNRKYRQALTPEEALATMEKEFINNHQKLDIILFDLFSRFVRETSSP